jgi:TatD family-associated radical SAM protein
MSKDVYVYEHAGALYINLTNRCTNDCAFCLRTRMDGLDGNYLWLSKEPTAAEVIAALGDMEGYDDVVFCGYGEPLIKLDEIIEIATYVKGKGKRTRINTNGHASAFHQKDVPPLLKGIIDKISISLNATDAVKYQKICRSVYKEQGFEYMLDFARGCVAAGIKTVLSVVEIIGEEEIEKARKIVADIGADFKVRTFIK